MDYFKNKKILVTGHSGFKGSWLTLWLSLTGASIFGISNNLNKKNIFKNHLQNRVKSFNIDITNFKSFKKTLNHIKPDYIFHLAAQSIVSKSYQNPIDTIYSNSIGTLNLLEILKNYKKECTTVIITSDKCYYNVEKNTGYKESDQLGGDDPYSASKAIAEIIFSSYFKSFLYKNQNLKIASARAGNVIGGNDWTEDRIVPDIIKSIKKNNFLSIRNFNATRPWQHVLEPLDGYIKLAKSLDSKTYINGESFNFGPNVNKNYSVRDVLLHFKKKFPLLKYKTTKDKNKFKEATLLSLNCKKAKNKLNWTSKLNFKETIDYTANWYLEYFNRNENIIEYSIKQIHNYEQS